MAIAFILPLRAVQAIFSIIVLGLMAYLIDIVWDAPGRFGLMLFTSIWTLLAVGYLVVTPNRFPSLAHKYAIFAVEAITMIFWFASWVALADLWGDWGCNSHTNFCRVGIAAIVFGAFLWLTFLATSILSALHISRTARSDTTAPPQMQGV